VLDDAFTALSQLQRASVFCGDLERARSLAGSWPAKREEVIDEAAARLATLRRPHPIA